MLLQTDAYNYVLDDPCDIPLIGQEDDWSELYSASDFLKEQQKALDWFGIPVVATFFNQREVLRALHPFLGMKFLLCEPTAPDEDYTFMLVDHLFIFDRLNIFH